MTEEISHIFLKEIFESPDSFEKTLRGNLLNENGSFRVAHSEIEFPNSIREKLEDHTIDKIYIIGQGTAAVAGQALGQYLSGGNGDFCRVNPVN
ncbi:MAG: hypothetical protein Ct9H90mP30_4800 [Actinomycetota bacterium]|nr:MAG: hypothetical protein Ct9H90mP30_4800 [Actinomycetota bacterium]